MDSLTQIVLGIVVAEVSAGKALRQRVFLYGAVLGTLPDLDVLIGKFFDPVDGVLLHRGISHSLLLFLLLSPILGWCISRIEKGVIGFRAASLVVFWCLFTHVLLDLFTSWGTQLFWPFPDRLALKTIFVIDPLYTLPLLIGLVMIWRTPNAILRAQYARRSLYFSSLYLLLSCGIKLYAVAQFEKALTAQKVLYEKLIVKPTAFNLILWNANVATEKGYLLGDYSLFDTQPIRFTTYPKNETLAKRLQHNPDFKKLQIISEGWYLLSQKSGKLYCNDLRFGLLNDDSKNPQFAFSYQFVTTPQGLKAIEVPKAKRDGKALLQKIFTRLQGN
ncbi:metal-dependent hydrolase [Flavobacterium luminosum]|uniref:Metal-dependent hydrolase n=1 Tax=Flavobacterium luminosum TaxID=2949086 RepID=A0ABT0TN33_9FLAO|nr:metal-dependent hydrolase [Flavobacterium sp. HXWNR70]MCL9808895.1 metal-dependent hydrolase [Flavobacterium sp. HXWNR70]